MRAALALLLALLPPAARATDWREHVTFTLSDRLRGEFADWFAPPPGAGARGAERWSFLANQLRAGARVTFAHVQAVVELQHTELAHLPDDASLAPPQGNLGPGAVYFAHTRRGPQGELFLKQGFVTLRRAGLAATLGRFDHRDGLETVPADATLATVKRTRIAERLVGPFDFTHVTRSFDGVRLVWDDPAWNATLLAVHPSHGGFEVSANREITEIGLAGLAATLKRLPLGTTSEARLFYLYYDDRRDQPTKVDNRPLAVRAADGEAITIHTVGGHTLAAADAGPGIVDVLLWGTWQLGGWGRQEHAAWAYAVEAGCQLPALPAAPWLRFGYGRSSGDDDPADGDHRSFFQLLPTARIYAQLPFYNLMNSSDLFAALLLRPHPRIDVRADWHWLRVSEGRDLWYAGGGATNDDVFGFAGAPANGRHELAHLADLSLSVRIVEGLIANAYYGHAFGGSVVGQSFAGEDADYGFVEVVYRR